MDALAERHRIVADREMAALNDLPAENVEFHSPFVWTPKRGRDQTRMILTLVSGVFEDFTYHRQWIDGGEWALELSARIGDLEAKGLDLISLGARGEITRFEVLIRPANALRALGEEMGRLMAAHQSTNKGE